jgi:hypothetical protein
MTDKDFIPWLQGFLTGKLELNMKDMALLKDAVDTVIPTHTITQIPTPTRKRYDEPIPNPMNPTCTTGKQLLTDEWKPFPKDERYT